MASPNSERTRLKRKHDALTRVSPFPHLENTEETRSPNESATGSSKRIKLSARGLEILEVLSRKRISIADIKFTDNRCQARGTYGDVAEATLVVPRRGTRRRRRVAVKKLRLFGDKTEAKLFCEFVNELRLLEKVSHPNIVKIIGFVEDMENSVAWLVFNWEDNGNLRQFLLSGIWELPERISLVDDVAAGLEYLHTLQPPICHGDLKSLNILVNSSNRAVITDFGSARIVQLGAASPAQPAASPAQPAASAGNTLSKRNKSSELKLTLTDSTLTLTDPGGSVRWAAPECHRGQPLDLASDIWALGWIAWEAITDCFPFEEITSETEVLMKVIEGSLPEIYQHDQLSQIHMLCSIMENCWKLEPKERLSATEFRKTISFVTIPLATDGDHAATRSAGLLMEIGDIHRLHGRDAEALKILEQGLAIARSTGDQIKLADLLSRKGEMLRMGSRCAEAERSFLEALEIYTSFGVDRGQADVLNGLGDVLTYQSRYIQAGESYTKALVIYNNTGDYLGQANALNGFGYLWTRQSKYVEAEASYNEAMAIYKSIGAGLGQANALTGQGDIRRERSQYIEAEECYTEAMAIYNSTGNEPGRINALNGLGHVRRQQSKYADAEVCYLDAIAISKSTGDDLGRANALQGIGSVQRQQFKYIEAEASYAKALAIYISIGDSLGQANALKGIGDTWMGQPRYVKAESFYLKALEIYKSIGDDLGHANALKALGDVMRQESKYLNAVGFYVDALAIYKSIGDDLGQGNALKALGEVWRVRYRHIEAEASHAEVVIYESVGKDLSPADRLKAIFDGFKQLHSYWEAEASYDKARTVNKGIWRDLGHGDLKPLNVLLYGERDYGLEREDSYARITNFGSARCLPGHDRNTQIEEMASQLPSAQPPSAVFDRSSKTITLTGNKYVLRWAAPEPLREYQRGLRSDIWSLGWIAYEFVFGSLPFEDAASEMVVIQRVPEGKLPSLTDNARLSLICFLLPKCWEAQPTQRPTVDSCRRSIEKMPMFAAEMEEGERVLSLNGLHELRQMYDSKGEHARVFTFFAGAFDPMTGPLSFTDQVQALRDLAQRAQLREEYSETIADYDVIWKLYEWNDKQDTDGLAPPLVDPG